MVSLGIFSMVLLVVFAYCFHSKISYILCSPEVEEQENKLSEELGIIISIILGKL